MKHMKLIKRIISSPIVMIAALYLIYNGIVEYFIWCAYDIHLKVNQSILQATIITYVFILVVIISRWSFTKETYGVIRTKPSTFTVIMLIFAAALVISEKYFASLAPSYSINKLFDTLKKITIYSISATVIAAHYFRNHNVTIAFIFLHVVGCVYFAKLIYDDAAYCGDYIGLGINVDIMLKYVTHVMYFVPYVSTILISTLATNYNVVDTTSMSTLMAFSLHMYKINLSYIYGFEVDSDYVKTATFIFPMYLFVVVSEYIIMILHYRYYVRNLKLSLYPITLYNYSAPPKKLLKKIRRDFAVMQKTECATDTDTSKKFGCFITIALQIAGVIATMMCILWQIESNIAVTKTMLADEHKPYFAVNIWGSLNVSEEVINNYKSSEQIERIQCISINKISTGVFSIVTKISDFFSRNDDCYYKAIEFANYGQGDMYKTVVQITKIVDDTGKEIYLTFNDDTKDMSKYIEPVRVNDRLILIFAFARYLWMEGFDIQLEVHYEDIYGNKYSNEYTVNYNSPNNYISVEQM